MIKNALQWTGIICFAIFVSACTSKAATSDEKQLTVNCCDSLTVYKMKVLELQEKVKKDSLFMAEQWNLVYRMADSLKLYEKTPLMTEELFLKVYRYKRLLYYYNICVKNSSQWQFYRGWSTRVFKGEEDKK